MGPEEIKVQAIIKKHGNRDDLVIQRHTGGLIMRGNRAVQAGLGKGQSDLLVIKQVLITPEMVGTHIAQHCVVEMKADLTKDRTEKKRKLLQQARIDVVRKLGGRAGFADSVEGFERIIFDD